MKITPFRHFGHYQELVGLIWLIHTKGHAKEWKKSYNEEETTSKKHFEFCRVVVMSCEKWSETNEAKRIEAKTVSSWGSDQGSSWNEGDVTCNPDP